MFPAIAAMVSLYGLFGDVGAIEPQLSALAGLIPAGAIEVIHGEMQNIVAQGGGKLGFAFAFGFAVSLWSANSGLKALMDALNVAYREKERRGFIRLNATSLLFTLLGLVFVVIALAALAALPVALDRFHSGPTTIFMLGLVRWPTLILLTLFVLATLYRYGPDRAAPQWRWVTWGGMIATAAWIAVSAGFTWYAAHFGSFDKTYGALGAVVGFMVWIWLSVTIILVGAEINCELEQAQRAQTHEQEGHASRR